MDSAKGEAFVSAKGGLGTLSLKTGTVTAFGNAVSSPKGRLFVAADRDERKWTVPRPGSAKGPRSLRGPWPVRTRQDANLRHPLQEWDRILAGWCSMMPQGVVSPDQDPAASYLIPLVTPRAAPSAHASRTHEAASWEAKSQTAARPCRARWRAERPG
ncbi:hypothetical protein ACIQB5_44375 [Streptomyces sp. NPDC088560]|uniref:hypothetical protein n=1 Tax=Streptomyces sp. NPDC088560 TaxID=3365868 RepID=UPI00381B8AE2